MKYILVTLLSTALLFGSYGCNMAQYNETIQSNAEANARVYSQKLGWQVTGVSCSDQDSDLDHYVSCDIEVKQGGSTATKNIECGYGAFDKNGCKTRMPKIVNQTSD